MLNFSDWLRHNALSNPNVREAMLKEIVNAWLYRRVSWEEIKAALG